jgi:hypothetical protein
VVAYFNGYQFVAAHFGAVRSDAPLAPFAGRGRRLGD